MVGDIDSCLNITPYEYYALIFMTSLDLAMSLSNDLTSRLRNECESVIKILRQLNQETHGSSDTLGNLFAHYCLISATVLGIQDWIEDKLKQSDIPLSYALDIITSVAIVLEHIEILREEMDKEVREADNHTLIIANTAGLFGNSKFWNLYLEQIEFLKDGLHILVRVTQM